VVAEMSQTLLENGAYMKEGAVEALEKALIFTIDAYSHSGLVSDNEIIQKLQDTLRHFKRRSISVPGSESEGIEAYVLVNCDLGLEEVIIKELLLVPEVTEVKGVFGVYDFIVKINTDSEEDIKRVIAKIRSMPVIKSSLTMMVIEAQASTEIEH
jgi:DNA-binding Lrp family transcriptional regulator